MGARCIKHASGIPLNQSLYISISLLLNIPEGKVSGYVGCNDGSGHQGLGALHCDAASSRIKEGVHGTFYW